MTPTPGARLQGHRVSKARSLPETHQCLTTGRDARAGRGRGIRKWLGNEEVRSSDVKGLPRGDTCGEGTTNF